MHRSRIGLVLIDHPEDGWDAALGFWAGVQGVTPVSEDESMPEYRSLGTLGSVAPGARVLEARDGHTILLDPAGLVFCVVPVQTGDDFERGAHLG
jgi:hypothetical protein